MDDEGADTTACLIRMVVLIVGVVAAVLAIVAVTIYARRALKEALMVCVLHRLVHVGDMEFFMLFGMYS